MYPKSNLGRVLKQCEGSAVTQEGRAGGGAHHEDPEPGGQLQATQEGRQQDHQDVHVYVPLPPSEALILAANTAILHLFTLRDLVSEQRNDELSFFFLSGVMNPFLRLPPASFSRRSRTSILRRSCSLILQKSSYQMIEFSNSHLVQI